VALMVVATAVGTFGHYYVTKRQNAYDE